MDHNLKKSVKAHWEDETCGTRYKSGDDITSIIQDTESIRYKLEPEILKFAQFQNFNNKKILEIGVGAGVDHLNWYKAGAIPYGIDLTEAAIGYTKTRLQYHEINTGDRLKTGDTESLEFDNNTFDLVYSWGVLHHTSDTEKAFHEVYRVLKPGGELKAMIYHLPSWTGWMLWAQHCLLKGCPFLSPRVAIYKYLESPGTKAYTLKEAEKMLSICGFKAIRLKSKLGPGDLLTIKPSKRYEGSIFTLIWKLYPRWLVRFLGDRFGLHLLIEASKLN
jgi:ubiquinone/menaquinone biosynthesis C-methylase UbiE